jgi:hypothetical protein
MLPVGYPDTALICGSHDCAEPAVIRLGAAELAAFGQGERVFAGPNMFAKMHASDRISEPSSEARK